MHRIQNGSKRRENKFERKKNFLKKSSVSTTSTLRKNFKNRKIFFSCIVFRMVQNVGKTSLSKKKFCRKNPLCVEDQNTWKKFQKSKKKFFAPRKRRLFGSIGSGSRSFLGIRQQAHSIFEKAKIFLFARCARGVARFARSTFLARNRREKLATFCFLDGTKIAFRARPPLKIASRFFGASFARKFPRFARTSLTRAGTSNEKK